MLQLSYRCRSHHRIDGECCQGHGAGELKRVKGQEPRDSTTREVGRGEGGKEVGSELEAEGESVSTSRRTGQQHLPFQSLRRIRIKLNFWIWQVEVPWKMAV